APPATEHLSGQPVELVIRPEEIELALHPENLRAQAIGQGIVRRGGVAGPMGRGTVQLNDGCDDPLGGLLTPSEARALNLQSEHEVWVGLRDYHLLPR